MTSEGIQLNRILLITITNVKLPVTADALHSVFFTYGEVLRIVCFPKQLGYQALVEMKTVEQAKAAQKNLDGKPMYHSPTYHLLSD
jgi:RNA recognition motif. (a.k.a. RRM, RBD, or RNP domain)